MSDNIQEPKNRPPSVIVVFKKEIPEEQAEELMKTVSRPILHGMDSSRGKAYFYATGPKFRITMEESEDPEMVKALYRVLPGIYEVYIADYTVFKD